MSTLDNNNNEGGVLAALVRDPEIPQGIGVGSLMECSSSSPFFNPALDWPQDDLNSPFQSLLDDLLSDYNSASAAADGNSSPLSSPELLAELLHRIFSQRSEFLAQLWVPVLRHSRLMLTTQDQPYAVQPCRTELVRYRGLSARYVFPAHGSPERELYPGLPGRVFSSLSPEWSPNVQHHHCTDFLRVRDAAGCNVRGTLAVPVIQPGTRQCLAVLELVTTAEKLDYDSELCLISRALQAMNLSSWNKDDGSWIHPEVPLSRGREAVFLELDEVLTAVCETHRLPMAQTWLPCRDQASGLINLSTRSFPFYVRDSSFRGFRKACCEQRLEIGQGVVGKAFTSNRPSYKGYVQGFSREEYPLLHYARCFKLGAAAAIRLRSSLTGNDDYVVEFILPPDCGEPQMLLRSLSTTMQRVCKTLRTAVSKQELIALEQGPSAASSSRIVELEETSVVVETSGVVDSRAAQEQERSTIAGAKRKKVKLDEPVAASSKLCSSEKKRATNEKTVALEVLQQHFAGSLRDAAKSIGVCPTTLKRICRQHGISRWPSRKINKVNRSLMKLQGVIESVEGVDRKVKLDSLTGELASTAAATAALTTKPGVEGLQIPGVEGMNVFQGPDESQGAAHEVQEQAPPGTSSWENFSIKIEPRVHGSSEALAFLERQNSLPLPPYPPTADVNPVEQKVQPCIDWAALKSRTNNDIASLNCFKDQLLTIKATMGNDTVRFKLSPGFGFETLKEEVGTRLRLEGDAFSLKYMDDDSEWVVLNDDGDLEECIDVMESSHARVIKLVVHVKGGSISSPSFCSVNS